MSNFLFFIFRSYYQLLLGFFVKIILMARGSKVGRNFKVDKFPKLILNNSNLKIGDNVTFYGEVEIRLIASGSLEILSNCKIDNHVRIIATNNASVKIDEFNVIGAGTIINAGDNITIGQKCLISGYVYLQSSSHGFKLGEFIRNQVHEYGPILIEDDVWIGSHSTILKGVTIRNGSIIGANSVVTNGTYIEQNLIFSGSPAVFKSNRKKIKD